MTRTTRKSESSRGMVSNNKDVEEEVVEKTARNLAKRREGGRIDEEANKRRAKVSKFLGKL